MQGSETQRCVGKWQLLQVKQKCKGKSRLHGCALQCWAGAASSEQQIKYTAMNTPVPVYCDHTLRHFFFFYVYIISCRSSILSVTRSLTLHWSLVLMFPVGWFTLLQCCKKLLPFSFWIVNSSPWAEVVDLFKFSLFIVCFILHLQTNSPVFIAVFQIFQVEDFICILISIYSVLTY